MPVWTENQKTAIFNRGSNLLVSAAAGSGKTAVLVERIIRLIIEDGVNIDEMLIVTFTNAAAAEMRERISNAIMKELEAEAEGNHHLRRQLTLLNKANISTLHSFCIEVIRRYFQLVNLDPVFRIADTTEIIILQQEIVEELFEQLYIQGDELFLSLVETFGGSKDDLPLQQLILRVYSFIQSQPYPFQWIKEKAGMLAMEYEEFEKSPWGRTLLEAIMIQFNGILDLLQDALELCKLPTGPQHYFEAINGDIEIVEELLASGRVGIEELYERIKGISHKAFSRAKRECDEALKEEVKELRNQAKEGIKKIVTSYFSRPPREAIEDHKKIYPIMDYLSQLLEEFHKEFRMKKAQLGIVDFNDLEHYALEILRNPSVAEEYRSKFKYIFIDEYQDSNIVQETIISSIKKENNVFMVGDVKQSIYRFRLADPSIFISKFMAYQIEDGSKDRRVDLSMNFRSRKEIIDGVNLIFKNIMGKTVGEIEYSQEAYLYPGREFPSVDEAALELHLVEKNMNTETKLDEELEELGDIEVEARIVAKRIKELMEKEIYDDKLEIFRKTQWKDIVVLLRSTKNWASVFSEVFVEEGIPVYADINSGYFEAIEINIFLNLLKVIDNKRQDIPLISVMRSPIGGFTVEELVEIRIYHKEDSFYDAIIKYINHNGDSLKNKLKKLINRLHSWANDGRYMKLDEFLWKLFVDSGYYHYVTAMPGGPQRQGNLRILLDRAQQFKNTSAKGLYSFISFIEKLQSSRGDMGSAKILSENDDVVRIMSIHKSKGLEFPIAIIAGLGKQFNLQDINSRLLVHKDLGLGPDYVDYSSRVVRDTFAKLAMKAKSRLESLSEEMRILYVALTRPKDKLILVASARDIHKHCQKWKKGLRDYGKANAKNSLDWIASVLLFHKDATLLREAGGFSTESFLKDPSKWIIKIHHPLDLQRWDKKHQAEKKKILHKLKNFTVSGFTQYHDEINKRLDWRYPYKDSVKIPSKLSVTDVKELQFKKIEIVGHNIPPLVKIPKFIEEKGGFTSAERGTILHFVLQHLELKDVFDEKSVEAQLKSMIRNEFLTKAEADTVDVEKVLRFVNSPVGERLCNAKEIYKERPFNLLKKAKDIINIPQANEDLLLQGVIDCYFIEDSKVVLLDYKSDYVPKGDVHLIKEKYKAQMDLYKEAIEKITKLEVKERYLYLFDIDEAVEI